MKTYHIISIFLILFCFQISFGQERIINGKVLDQDLLELPWVLISYNSKVIDTSDFNGIFRFKVTSEMKKIDILSYPEEFIPKTEGSTKTDISPHQSYNIKIMIDGEEKEVAWKDNEASETPEAVQLRSLFEKIQKYIMDKEEYKKLPEPNSAYQ